jgi:SPX domain protein involved in polyphosphate accumulation
MVTKITKTFKRHELKYFVTPLQFETIKNEIDKRLILDSFCRKQGCYSIYNIYFDTANDEIIKHCLSKPYYREKLRLRSYTVPLKGSDNIFLELKKKINGVSVKRRAVLPFAQANDFLTKRIVPLLKSYEDQEVIKEIAYFLSRYQVGPKVFISYRRLAYLDVDDPSFRLSFDFDILTRREEVSFFYGDYGTELLDTDDILMEIKCGKSIPFWLCRLLSEMGIHRTSFSKYGAEYKKFRAAPYLYQGVWEARR